MYADRGYDFDKYRRLLWKRGIHSHICPEETDIHPAFAARLVGGEARTSSESRSVEWVAPEAVDDLAMHPSMRMRLAHALAGGKPHIG